MRILFGSRSRRRMLKKRRMAAVGTPLPDGLKLPVSRRVKFIDHSLLGSSFLGPRNERFNRCLSPPGFRSAPQSGGYGALIAPSTEIFSYDLYIVWNRAGAEDLMFFCWDGNVWGRKCITLPTSAS